MRQFFGIALILAISGCGGGGRDAVVASPFTGHWDGTWSGEVDGVHIGTASMLIEFDGNVFGSMSNQTTGQTAQCNGEVSDSGHVEVSIAYPGSPTLHGEGEMELLNGGTTLNVVIMVEGKFQTIFNLIRAN